MKCDTCRQEVPEVMRVVVYKNYDRTLARAIYNCPECYRKKEAQKQYMRDAGTTSQADGEPPTTT